MISFPLSIDSLAVRRAGIAAATFKGGVLVALAAALALRRWEQIGRFPTGLDAGNWLAFGRGMFGDGKSTAGAYPPLAPFLHDLLARTGDPFPGIKLLAIVSLLAPALAIYIVASRHVSWWFALGAGALLASSRPFSEPAAFGGYPQDLAAAFGIVAVSSGLAYLRSGRRAHLAVASGAMLLAALTHHLYFLASLLWFAACAGAWAVQAIRRDRQLIRSRLPVLIVPAAGVAGFVPTWVLIAKAGYAPPFNAAGVSFWDAWNYATGGEHLAWDICYLASIAGLLFAVRQPQHRQFALLGGSALLVGSAGFVATGEGRLFALVFIGMALGLAAGLEWARVRWSGTSLAGVPFALVLGAVFLVVSADAQASEDFSYYRTLEPGMADAALWLDTHTSGETVAVQANARGWPVGWWFEGLVSSDRVLVGSDERWLGFPEEREHARDVAALFEFGTPIDEIQRRAESLGIRYLVFSISDWTGWRTWTVQPAYVFDSPTYRIVDLSALRSRP